MVKERQQAQGGLRHGQSVREEEKSGIGFEDEDCSIQRALSVQQLAKAEYLISYVRFT